MATAAICSIYSLIGCHGLYDTTYLFTMYLKVDPKVNPKVSLTISEYFSPEHNYFPSVISSKSPKNTENILIFFLPYFSSTSHHMTYISEAVTHSANHKSAHIYFCVIRQIATVVWFPVASFCENKALFRHIEMCFMYRSTAVLHREGTASHSDPWSVYTGLSTHRHCSLFRGPVTHTNR